MENYFLKPEYLMHSDFLKMDSSNLKEKIRSLSQERLYMDVVNYVIVSILLELKRKWIDKFKDSASFLSKNQVLKKLKDANQFIIFKKK